MKDKIMGLSGGIFVFFIAAVFFISSLDLPYSSELGPGPGFWPLWLSGLLLILSLCYIYSVWKGKDSAEEAPDRKAQKEMVIILGSMSLYVVLLPILGFNLSSMLFLFVLLRKGYNWYVSLGISAVASVLLFLLFTEGFATPLPVNIWGF